VVVNYNNNNNNKNNNNKCYLLCYIRSYESAAATSGLMCLFAPLICLIIRELGRAHISDNEKATPNQHGVWGGGGQPLRSIGWDQG